MTELAMRETAATPDAAVPRRGGPLRLEMAIAWRYLRSRRGSKLL